MNEISNTQPRMTQAELIMQMAQLNVDYEKKLKELEQRLILLEEQFRDFINKKEEVINRSTIASYVTRNGLPIYVSDLPSFGRRVTSLCKKRGYEPRKICVERFGEVNTYPDLILYEFFDSYLKDQQAKLASEVTTQMQK